MSHLSHDSSRLFWRAAGAVVAGFLAVTVHAQQPSILAVPRAHRLDFNPISVMTADVDGDGNVELAVRSDNGSQLFIFAPTPDGGLSERTPIPMVTGSGEVIPCELNGDGRTDFVTPNGQFVQTMLGTPTGLFEIRQAFVGGSVRRVTVGDFNGDGLTDAVALWEASNTDAFMLMEGDGRGALTSINAIESGSTSGNGLADMLLADMNNDGRDDLLVLSRDFDVVSIRPSLGDFKFGPPRSMWVGNDADAFDVVDLTGDGLLDVVVLRGTPRLVCVMWNSGEFILTPPAYYAIGEVPTHLIVGDTDGDGDDDVVVRGIIASWAYQNIGGGLLSAAEELPADDVVKSEAILDVNRDFMPDIVQLVQIEDGAPTPGSLRINMTRRDGTHTKRYSSVVREDPGEVVAGLITNDAREDFAVIYQTNRVAIHNNTGNGQFAALHAISTQNPWEVALGNVTGAGLTDMVVALQAGQGIFYAAQTSAGNFSAQTLSYPQSRSVALGTINSDTSLDVATSSWTVASPRISLGFNPNNGTFPSTPSANVPLPRDAESIQLVDWEGDGDLDLVALLQNSTEVTIALNDGTGAYPTTQTRNHTAGLIGVDIVATHLDGNAQADIVMARRDQLPLVFWNGATTAVELPDYAASGRPMSFYGRLSARDMNADGRIDVMLPETNHSICVWLQKPGASFEPAQAYFSGGERPINAAPADIDGDGDIDLIVPCLLSDAIYLLPGTRNDLPVSTGGIVR